MDFITILAIDRHTSDSMSRTFNGNNLEKLKVAIEEWEKEIPYGRYGLSCQEIIADADIEELLEDLDVEV